MKITAKLFTVASLGLTMVATSLMPANAVTVPVPVAKPVSDVAQVQYHRPPPPPPGYRPPPGHNRPGWHNNRPGWHNGYRGYDNRRPGYRRHSDGRWYPLAAFALGAVVGGAMNAPSANSSRHVQWCTERYRTYRASDNTYVPRAGVRAQCRSPY